MKIKQYQKKGLASAFDREMDRLMLMKYKHQIKKSELLQAFETARIATATNPFGVESPRKKWPFSHHAKSGHPITTQAATAHQYATHCHLAR